MLADNPMRNLTAGRSFFFALVLTSAMVAAFQELEKNSPRGFLIITILATLLLGIELLVSMLVERKNVSSSFMIAESKSTRWYRIINHALLPFSVLWGLMAFAFFSPSAAIQIALAATFLIVFTLYFSTIQQYYRQEHTDQYTHYIYDLFKLIIFFTSCFAVLHLSRFYSQHLLITLVPIITFGLLVLMGQRYRFAKLETLFWATGLTLAVTIICWGSTLAGLNPLVTATATFIGFYISAAILHHHIHQDLHPSLIIEYITLLALTLFLLFGIAR